MPDGLNIKWDLTKEEVSPLVNFCKSIHPLSKLNENFIRENLFAVSLKKGKILHNAGEVSHNLYFMTQGAMRGYIKEGKDDSTTWITCEGEMVAPIYSFINQVPTLENVQALEDCMLLGISHVKIEEMYRLFPEFNFTARVIYEKYYSDAEIRALIPRLKNAEIKYDYFLSTYSHLSNRIQLKHIASFLGMKLETLSRVRASKMKKPEIN